MGGQPQVKPLAPDLLHEILGQFFELAQAEIERYGGTINRFLGQEVRCREDQAAKADQEQQG